MSKRALISKKLRFQVLRRDLFCCRYCGAQAGDVRLHIDHRVAVSRGGTNEITNLITACEACNLGKGALEKAEVSVPLSIQLCLQFLHGIWVAKFPPNGLYDVEYYLNHYYESGRSLDVIRDDLIASPSDAEKNLIAALESHAPNYLNPKGLH